MNLRNNLYHTQLGAGGDDLKITHSEGPVVATNTYYPNGAPIAGLSFQRATTPVNRFKFIDREYVGDYGLELYDHLARWYDPWWGPGYISVDILADEFVSWTPYQYAFRNPARYVDKTGMAPEECEGCKDRVTSTSQSISNITVTENFDGEGNSTGYTANFGLTQSENIETVNEEGEVVDSRTETTTSAQTLDFDASGRQIYDSGDPVMRSTIIPIAGGKTGKKVTERGDVKTYETVVTKGTNLTKSSSNALKLAVRSVLPSRISEFAKDVKRKSMPQPTINPRARNLGSGYDDDNSMSPRRRRHLQQGDSLIRLIKKNAKNN